MVPRSIKHTPGHTPDCEYKVPLEIPHGALPPGQELSVIYTYSVTYTVSIKIERLSIIYTSVVLF